MGYYTQNGSYLFLAESLSCSESPKPTADLNCKFFLIHHYTPKSLPSLKKLSGLQNLFPKGLRLHVVSLTKELREYSYTKKERRTKAAPRTLARGLTKQHMADAPIPGTRSTYYLRECKSTLKCSGWRFPEKQYRTHTRQFNCFGRTRGRVKLPPTSHYNDLSRSTV